MNIKQLFSAEIFDKFRSEPVTRTGGNSSSSATLEVSDTDFSKMMKEIKDYINEPQEKQAKTKTATGNQAAAEAQLCLLLQQLKLAQRNADLKNELEASITNKRHRNRNIENLKDVHFDKEHTFKIDKMDDKDIEFFKEFSKNPEVAIQSFNQQLNQANMAVPATDGQISYKSVELSQELYEIIEKAYNSQKPVRLDFESGSSVILKINATGQLSAEFVSRDLMMENLIKNNIQSLRDKLDSEGIPYKEISYKQNQQQQQQKKKDNDESNGG